MGTVAIPPRFVVSFDDAREGNVDAVGLKGWYLSRLRDLGYDTPDGFVVTAAAYEAATRGAHVDHRLAHGLGRGQQRIGGRHRDVGAQGPTPDRPDPVRWCAHQCDRFRAREHRHHRRRGAGRSGGRSFLDRSRCRLRSRVCRRPRVVHRCRRPHPGHQPDPQLLGLTVRRTSVGDARPWARRRTADDGGRRPTDGSRREVRACDPARCVGRPPRGGDLRPR